MKKVHLLPIILFLFFVFSCKDKDDLDLNKINGHEYVDLGLSVKWATCNVGASSAEQPGDYYSWGSLTPNIQSDGLSDTPITEISGTDLDVAHFEWGKSWRIPTSVEMNELITLCKWEWVTFKGMNGFNITGPNGNSIFLPAAGLIHVDNRYGEQGFYWTSNRCEGSIDYNAYGLHFINDGHGINGWNIPNLFSVRPVSN